MHPGILSVSGRQRLFKGSPLDHLHTQQISSHEFEGSLVMILPQAALCPNLLGCWRIETLNLSA